MLRCVARLRPGHPRTTLFTKTYTTGRSSISPRTWTSFNAVKREILHEISDMSSAPVKVAVGQMCAKNDVLGNFETCKLLAEESKQAGCAMLFLPECFSYIGSNLADALAVAEPLEGHIMSRYRDLARSTGLWLSLGGFQETGPDAQHRYNTHVMVDSEGNIVASYRKIHLFDLDLPDGPEPIKLLESSATAPGCQVAACDSPAGRVGLTVCYDMRFPELYQKLRFEEGAEILTMPSAFTRPTGEAHWEVLLRARAIETQCFVVAAAQTGQHNEKRASYGHAIIINPWGKVIGKLDDPNSTGIAVAEIDLNELRKIRQNMPLDKHRRYDLYQCKSPACE
mmetsp:Transcript_13229/g.25311  ORF Transcript_13229/g.25311 Transcript_13229/m.25311 type:complete len:339 (+) Transcript_13229:30-1046(+)